jgi:outer membrane protein
MKMTNYQISKITSGFFKRSLLVCALSGLIASALAQDALLQNAKNLLAAKQAPQAYELLARQETERAGQPEFDYLLGIAALDAGRITQSIFALERVLAVQPNNSLARAELARALVASGETDTAKTQLQQVRAAADVPPEARASIERLLASLDSAAQVKALALYVEAGIGHDSNLSGGPNISTFAVPLLGGAVFNLAPAARERSDRVIQLGAGVSYQHALSANTDLLAHLSWRSTLPTSEKTLDSENIDGSLGVAHTVDANRYSFSVQLGHLAFDGSTYRKTTGLSAQWLRNLSGGQQLTAFVQHAKLRYPAPGLNDTNRTVLGGAWGFPITPATSAYIGAGFGGETADKAAGKEFGYKLSSLRAGGEHVLSPQMRLFANLGWETRRHRAPDAFFLTPRQDDQLDLTLGLHYQLAPSSYGKWRITPQLSHTKRSSNINVYGMKRTQLNLTARLEF